MDVSTAMKQRGTELPIIGTVVWTFAVILGAFAAITSFMLFDATGTDGAETWVWLCFYGIWGFEFMAALAIPGVWIAWTFTRNRSVTILLIVGLSPLVPLAVLAYGLISGI